VPSCKRQASAQHIKKPTVADIERDIIIYRGRHYVIDKCLALRQHRKFNFSNCGGGKPANKVDRDQGETLLRFTYMLEYYINAVTNTDRIDLIRYILNWCECSLTSRTSTCKTVHRSNLRRLRYRCYC